MPRSVWRMSCSSSTTRMLCTARLRSSHLAGERQLDDEFGSGGMVLFHSDGAVVVLYNAPHNGQPQASAALLGGKVRKEEFFLHFPIAPVPGIGHRDLPPIFPFCQRPRAW